MALEGVAGWLIDVEGTLVGDKAYRPLPGAGPFCARDVVSSSHDEYTL